jgi:hypothetical protein
MGSELYRPLYEPSDNHSPSAWWVVAWIAGGLLLGAAVGALVGDVTYKPDPYSIDLGRGFNEIFGAVVWPLGFKLVEVQCS